MQEELDRFLRLLQVVEDERLEDLERPIVGKLLYRLDENSLGFIVLPQTTERASQSQQGALSIVAFESVFQGSLVVEDGFPFFPHEVVRPGDVIIHEWVQRMLFVQFEQESKGLLALLFPP